MQNELRLFFNRIMVQTQAVTALGFPVMSCKVFHPEKNFAFMEFRTVEEASNCLALDGVLFSGCHLRVRTAHCLLRLIFVDVILLA